MGRRLPMKVTYLEMREPPRLRATPPLEVISGKAAILRAVHPPVHFYRYLYDAVGAKWHWVERKKISDVALAAIVQHEDVHLYVLYVEGAPAGYAELDFRKKPDVELSYFGIVPEYIGRKFGPVLLAHAIHTAWELGAGRLLVNTCTLDHPRALPLYQRMGFSPYDRRDAEIELLD